MSQKKTADKKATLLSFLWNGLDYMADLFRCGCAFLLCGLPLVTGVGAAAALVQCIRELRQQQSIGESLLRRFFREIRSRLKQSILLSLLVMGLYGAAGISIWLCLAYGSYLGKLASVLLSVYIGVLLVLAGTLGMYLPQILARLTLPSEIACRLALLCFTIHPLGTIGRILLRWVLYLVGVICPICLPLVLALAHSLCEKIVEQSIQTCKEYQQPLS